jgi:flavin reductase (DIM6/NTAB) family NADH-FMN oxidoreductase RutF
MTAIEAQRQLAAALGRIPSGLFVVTFRHGSAETGMLASWVQQCSFDPPHLSLAVKTGRAVIPWLTPGSPFTVNVLDDTQTDMIVHFGRGFDLNQPAFTDIEIERLPQGAPVLSEALAYLDCRLSHTCPVADHVLVIGEVVAGRLLSEGHPMVHIRKSGMHY